MGTWDEMFVRDRWNLASVVISDSKSMRSQLRRWCVFSWGLKNAGPLPSYGNSLIPWRQLLPAYFNKQTYKQQQKPLLSPVLDRYSTMGTPQPSFSFFLWDRASLSCAGWPWAYHRPHWPCNCDPSASASRVAEIMDLWHQDGILSFERHK